MLRTLPVLVSSVNVLTCFLPVVPDALQINSPGSNSKYSYGHSSSVSGNQTPEDGEAVEEDEDEAAALLLLLFVELA